MKISLKTSFSACLLIVLFAVFLPGCSKKDSTPAPVVPPVPEYFIKFKIDGVQKEFNYNSRATISDASINSSTPLILGAFSGSLVNSTNASAANFMSVYIKDQYTMVVNKTYTNTVLGGLYQVGLDYRDENGGLLGSEYVSNFSDSDAVLLFSEIKDDHVSGTFSGKVSLSGSSASHTITDGSFKLKRY